MKKRNRENTAIRAIPDYFTNQYLQPGPFTIPARGVEGRVADEQNTPLIGTSLQGKMQSASTNSKETFKMNGL